MASDIPFNVDMTTIPEVTPFLDPVTSTISYVVKDPDSNHCAVIDSVLDFDYSSGRVSYDSSDRVIEFIERQSLTVDWIVETHVHADHLSGAPYVQQKLGGKLGIGEQIITVQNTFGKIFNEGSEFQRDGSQFDQLFGDGDHYAVGGLTFHTMHTPGHTPACMTHVVGNAAFVGDSLFMPDSGSARADFPGGDARTLYRSVKRLLSLPDEMRLFMCHDYGTGGRDIAWESTVLEERLHNVDMKEGISEDDFVALREAKDAKLDMPRLIIPSLQVNIRAGELPVDESGNPMLKIPVNRL